MKTYAVAITAGEATYNFHVPSKSAVRELVLGSSDVKSLTVQEETHDYTAVEFRLMSTEEVLGIMLGQTA
jgi:hypothetical protein